MSTRHIVLIHVPENAWRDLAPEDWQPIGERHRAFIERSALEGHRLVAGGALAFSETSTIVRPGVGVTDGPFAELAEQVGGYYEVETDDADALVRALDETFAGDGCVYEVRPIVPQPEVETLRATTLTARPAQPAGAPAGAA